MKALLKRIMSHYGYEHQVGKLKEEATELANFTDEENMKEEIADVLNMCEQVIQDKGWEDDIRILRYKKIIRTLKRMKDEPEDRRNSGRSCQV